MVKRYSFDVSEDVTEIYDFNESEDSVETYKIDDEGCLSLYYKSLDVEVYAYEYEDENGDWIKYEDYKKLKYILNKYIEKYGYQNFKYKNK